jgi:hypothetical protein
LMHSAAEASEAVNLRLIRRPFAREHRRRARPLP